jgi:hypothetical protein
MRMFFLARYSLPEYLIIQPSNRDGKEYLVIDRTHEDIQIHSRLFD